MLSKKQSIRAPFHNLLSLLSTCLGKIHHKIVLYLPCSTWLGKIHHKIVLYLPCSLPAWEKFNTKLSYTCLALYLAGKSSPQNCLTFALLYTCLGKYSPQNCLVLALFYICLGKMHHRIALLCTCLGKMHHKIALYLLQVTIIQLRSRRISRINEHHNVIIITFLIM